MLIVGLNGSPNKKGNSDYLLDLVLKKVEELGAETVMFNAGELLASAKHSFCTQCSNPCTGICYKDSKLEEAFNVLKKADGIVFASPVYFGTVSAQLKAMFDKSRRLRGQKALLNKVAAAVTVGHARYGGQETTIRAIHDIAIVHGMILIGDGYFEDDCGHHGVAAQRPAESDPNAAKRAEVLAKRMVEVCGATESIRKNY